MKTTESAVIDYKFGSDSREVRALRVTFHSQIEVKLYQEFDGASRTRRGVLLQFVTQSCIYTAIVTVPLHYEYTTHFHGTNAFSQAMRKSLSFYHLPDEVLLEIFKWLPFYHRVTLLPLVCKRWYTLTKDRSLFHKVDFRCISIRDQESHRVMEFLKTVQPRELILTCDVKLEDFGESATNHATTLSNLSVYESCLPSTMCVALPNLTTLRLHCVLSHVDVQFIAKSLQKLTKLEISVNNEVEEIFTVLFDDEGINERLQEFVVASVKTIEKWTFLTWLRRCKSLRGLCLEFHECDSIPIDEVLHNCEYLESLELIGPFFTFEKPPETVRHLKHLRHFELSTAWLGLPELKAVLNIIGNSVETLTILLTISTLPDDCLKLIAFNCLQLIALQIGSGGITGQSVVDLNLAQLMPKLLYMNFVECDSDNVFDILASNNPTIVIQISGDQLLNCFLQPQVFLRELQSRIVCHNSANSIFLGKCFQIKTTRDNTFYS